MVKERANPIGWARFHGETPDGVKLPNAGRTQVDLARQAREVGMIHSVTRKDTVTPVTYAGSDVRLAFEPNGIGLKGNWRAIGC